MFMNKNLHEVGKTVKEPCPPLPSKKFRWKVNAGGDLTFKADRV